MCTKLNPSDMVIIVAISWKLTKNLISMKRAGAQRIITYHALDAARWLKEI